MLVSCGHTLFLISFYFKPQYSKCLAKRFSDVDIMRSRPGLISGGPTLAGKCFAFFQPPAFFCKIKFMCKDCWSTCHTSFSLGWSWINMVCIFRSHSYVEEPFLFLKGQEVEISPSAAARACTICACPVTLSSSSNIQTSVQFKLAGHGPVTYFPDNMLCNIKDEAVCHQLTNLYRHTAPANRHETPDSTARQKQKRN